MLIKMAKNKKLTLRGMIFPILFGFLTGFGILGYQFYEKQKGQQEKLDAFRRVLPVVYEQTGDQLIDFIVDGKIITIIVLSKSFDGDKDLSLYDKSKRYSYLKENACHSDIYNKYFYKAMLEGGELIFKVIDENKKNIFETKLNSSSCKNIM